MSQTVLVTGASRGIGKAIALKFASRGYQVVINCAKSKEALYSLRDEITASKGVPCLAVPADVGNSSEVSAMFEEINHVFGGADVLINNAGISYIGLLSDMPDEEWNRVIQTNLSSAFYCAKHAIPYMVQKKSGKIIQVSSIWGTAGASCEVAYSASKGGINAFTKALAKELAPSNIQVNAVACGVIDTEMNNFLSEEERASLIEDIPACRMGTAEEAADLIFSLCSGHSYLNGQIITLDGGYL